MNIKTASDIIKPELLPNQSYICPKHGVYTGCPMEIYGRTIDPQCPQCDQAIAEEESKYNKIISALSESVDANDNKQRCVEMNIGEKFWEESFDTFDPYTDELKRHFDISITFASNPKGRMLVMLGKNGNGKDHLAASILKKTGGLTHSVFEIELLLKECYSGRKSEIDLYNRLCSVEVLVLNEIGRHKAGKWEMDFMSYIIDKRYQNYKPVILISNKHLRRNNCKDECPDCLQTYIGNDVISRIAEGGEVMEFTGEDYRYIKRGMAN